MITQEIPTWVTLENLDEFLPWLRFLLSNVSKDLREGMLDALERHEARTLMQSLSRDYVRGHDVGESMLKYIAERANQPMERRDRIILELDSINIT